MTERAIRPGQYWGYLTAVWRVLGLVTFDKSFPEGPRDMVTLVGPRGDVITIQERGMRTDHLWKRLTKRRGWAGIPRGDRNPPARV